MTKDEAPHRPVTQRDVAQALGLSHSTVSRALHNSPRIPEARRREIQAAAEAMGYRFNPMAVALSHHRKASRTTPVQASLAWINLWPEPKRLYSYREFELYRDGAAEEARRDGYRIEEIAAGEGVTMARLRQIMRARGIQGVFLPPLPHGRLPPDWEEMDWSEFCVIRFGYSIRHPSFHVVASDQVTDGIIGYDRIRGMGYRRIGIIQSRRSYTRFIAGALFRQTRLEEGFGCPVLALTEDDTPQADRERLQEWLVAHRPDAVFTGVAGIRKMLEGLGYNVPRDIGLATFSVLDGQADAGIDQNSREIGKAAVQMLLSLINHNEHGIPETCRELLVEGRWQDGSTLPGVV